jgi:hypothetical protein
MTDTMQLLYDVLTTPQDRREEALRAENEALRGALQDAKWELSKLKAWDGKNYVWQSYHGRIAYETLDEALNK